MPHRRNRRKTNEQQVIELRLKSTEVFGMVFVFGTIGITGIVKPDLLHQSQGNFALILRSLGLLCLVYTVVMGCSLSRTVVAANTSGIRWYAHRQNHEIEWEKIKAIYVQRGRSKNEEPYYIDLLLVLRNEEIIKLYPFYLGSVDKRQEWLDFVAQRVEVIYKDRDSQT